MLPALLTVILFAASAVAGERTARYWGSERGNIYRLTLATLVLGVISAICWPASLHQLTYSWLFISGIVGFGFGDIALFLAYVRVGARLAILLNLCTAPLWSTLMESLWLGITPGLGELIAGSVILVGVGMAVMSRRPTNQPRFGDFRFGVICGIVAGCGQGAGAVISRKAFAVATANAIEINGISSAAQRVSGGLATTLLIYMILALLYKGRGQSVVVEARLAIKTRWLVLATLCGPVIGVSCFQWALASQPAGIVTAMVATTPIAMIPLAMIIDKESPSRLAAGGALVAVAGVLMLMRLQGQW